MMRKLIKIALGAAFLALLAAPAFSQAAGKIRPAIKDKLVEAQKLGQAKNYNKALALIDRAEASPNKSFEEQSIIHQMRLWLRIKSGKEAEVAPRH